jgi:hypothetical protein
VERELEVVALPGLCDRGQHADDVAVVEGKALDDALQAAASPKERSVDAAAVDDEPTRPDPLERAMGSTRDEELGIRLEGDVIDLREAADCHAFARQIELDRLIAAGPTKQHFCRVRHERDSIDRPSHVHGSASLPLSHSITKEATPEGLEESCSDSARHGSASPFSP